VKHDIPTAMELPLSQLREHELHAYNAKCATMRGNPYEVLRRKTKALAELLGCDEPTAEAIILHRVDVAFAQPETPRD
jgi:hypothetical protein